MPESPCSHPCASVFSVETLYAEQVQKHQHVSDTLMTCPAPSVNSMGWFRLKDESNTRPLPSFPCKTPAGYSNIAQAP